jgi:murE/murF fusion protein
MLISNYFKKINSRYKNHYFSGLSFNSLTCKKNDIFFAIKGTQINGNKFVKNAIKNGAKTVVSNQKYQGIKNDILYIHSSNVRKLLAETSFRINKKKPKNLIAVTGTNGKSSVANFYFQILKLNKKKVASIGTLGIQTISQNISSSNTTLDPIKLSISLKKLKDQKIDNVILEASSHGLEQNRLDGLKFKTGIFTNLSHDHLDYHKNLNNYLNSKLYLFKELLTKKANIITDT